MDDLSYSITRQKRRSISIQFNVEGKLQIKAPHSMSDPHIKRFLLLKSSWIEKQKTKFENSLNWRIPQPIISEKRIPYLGQHYTIKCCIAPALSVFFDKHTLIVAHPKGTSSEDLYCFLIQWYKQQALEILSDRVAFFAHKLKVSPTTIRVKSLRSRWGSCSSLKAINLNWCLIKVPLDIADYVVVHELCHLIHMDHSQKFWDLVATIVPDWKAKRKWLHEHPAIIDLR